MPVDPASSPERAQGGGGPRDPQGPRTERIDEVEFNPVKARKTGPGGWKLALMIIGGGATVFLLGVLWFVFSARSVHVNVSPLAEIQFDSDRLQFQLGDRFLTLPGEAVVRANRDGYYPLEESVVVDDRANQTFEFELVRKPGFLIVEFDREVADPVIRIDDSAVDNLRVELTAGMHDLQIDAPRFAPFETRVDIDGGGNEQTLLVSLTPDWADVTFSSVPAGAQILVDGKPRGTTPGMVEILAGAHEVALAADGYKTWRRPLRSVANVPQSFDDIELEKADGLLSVSSTPGGAAVAVNGRYRGQTPIELRLPPGQTYSLTVSRSGFETATRRVPVRSDRDLSLNIELAARFGRVVFALTPPNASVFVDGEQQTLTDNSVSLPAVEQQIEIRAPGYVAQTKTLTPNPAYAQTVTAELLTVAEAREAAIPKRITTHDGQIMLLMRPYPFQMGASRRERGRRANEVLREVDGLPEYYISTVEVTNARFKAFRPEHDSGFVYKESLGGNDNPVVNLTVRDAMAYCNWLSEQDGLTPVYDLDDTGVSRREGSGYRLPTEAEWAFAARYAGRAKLTRFPWGDSMPPEANSGNYADRAAIGLTSATLKTYSDGFPSTSPVGSFEPTDAGLFDIAGNVTEWTETEYAVGVATGAASGGGTLYVARGSSWMHSDLSELRMTFRDFSDVGRPDIGFRIVRDVEEPEF